VYSVWEALRHGADDGTVAVWHAMTYEPLAGCECYFR
jgi:hypothetical protein